MEGDSVRVGVWGFIVYLVFSLWFGDKLSLGVFVDIFRRIWFYVVVMKKCV